MVIVLYLWYIQNGAPKLLLMAQPLKHPSPSLEPPQLSYDSALHYGLFTLDDVSADKSFSVNSPLIVWRCRRSCTPRARLVVLVWDKVVQSYLCVFVRVIVRAKYKLQHCLQWIEGFRERTEHTCILRSYFFFPPITQWCSISDVLFTDGRECQILVF